MNILGLSVTRGKVAPVKPTDSNAPVVPADRTPNIGFIPGQGSDVTPNRIVPTVPSEYYQILPKLTPVQIRMLLLSGMQGNFSWWYDLTSIMQDSWPRLLKDLHEVRDACRNTKFIARAYCEHGDEPTDSAQEKADFINKAIKSFEPIPGGDERNFSGTVYNMAGAIIAPQVQEIIWKRGDKGEWLPRATAWVHSRRLGLRQDGRIGIQPVIDNDITYNTTQNRAPVELPPNKFIYSIYPTRDGSMTMSGLLRPLAWWWGAMMYGRDWALIYAQLFGQPFRWATYRQGLPEADRLQLDNMLANMGSSGYGSFLEGTTVNFTKADGLGQDNPQRWLIDHADEYADLLIKGETLTDRSQANAGQMRGNSSVGAKVRSARIEGMCSWLADDLTDQLVRPMMLLNYGNTDEMPRIVADYSEPQTGLELAQTAQIWLASYDMDAHEAAELSGLPLVKKQQPIQPTGPLVRPNGNGKDKTLEAMLRAMNENHAPAGSPEGGQFTSGGGSSGGRSVRRGKEKPFSLYRPNLSYTSSREEIENEIANAQDHVGEHEVVYYSDQTANLAKADISHLPHELQSEIKSWPFRSKSPYSDSFYNAPDKGWSNTAEGSLRIADHWNFESQGEIHARTDTDVPHGHWAMARYEGGKDALVVGGVSEKEAEVEISKRQSSGLDFSGLSKQQNHDGSFDVIDTKRHGEGQYKVLKTFAPLARATFISADDLLRAISAPASHEEKMYRALVQKFAESTAKANMPLTKRLQALSAITDDDEWADALRAVAVDFPVLAKSCMAAIKPSADVLESGISGAIISGLTNKNLPPTSNGKVEPVKRTVQKEYVAVAGGRR